MEDKAPGTGGAFNRPQTPRPASPFSHAELHGMLTMINMEAQAILNDDPYRKPKK